MVIKIISKQTILIVYAYMRDVEFKSDLIYTAKKIKICISQHTHEEINA